MEKFFNRRKMHWPSNHILPATFTCSFCGSKVTSDIGLPLVRNGSNGEKLYTPASGVYICNNCYTPTFVSDNFQYPAPRIGKDLNNIPQNINNLYEEARRCYSADAYTGVILLCRKLLMHVAIDQGAKCNKKFIDYVNFFVEEHYINVKSKPWIDRIRQMGNDANHEIKINSEKDARMIILFCEMLLATVYEYPGIEEEFERKQK